MTKARKGYDLANPGYLRVPILTASASGQGRLWPLVELALKIAFAVMVISIAGSMAFCKGTAIHQFNSGHSADETTIHYR